MQQFSAVTPEEIRARRAADPKQRDRDVAEVLGISEAELVAAHIGQGDGRRAIKVEAHPDRVIPAVESFGQVMALTRIRSAVHEKIGQCGRYHQGHHAAMVLTEAIDLRIFPGNWRHAFMVEVEGEGAARRSLQVFDGAGDAVYKVHLREGSDLVASKAAPSALALPDQPDRLAVSARAAPDGAKARPDKLDVLQREWRRMTDTHQFLRLVSKLKMNRLGAYRIAGEPFVRQLAPSAVDAMLHAVRDAGIEIMLFVGNRGCIQIHSGPIQSLRPMGPWQNVMDPDFNLHLRADHVTEVWAVDKPTQRGPAVSVEAFDGDGQLILQCFGVGKEGRDHRPAWAKLVAGLKGLADAPVT